MKLRTLILVWSLFLCTGSSAQEGQSTFGVTFSGFVKTDVMYDSRQTISLREGHFLLYPSPVVTDQHNNDINAKASFNILSIQTRMLGKITGPDALGARTSGLIEGEFFGTSDADINGFRLRHAFIRMDWKRVSLLVGQFWHPMFVVEMFPGVVSFNTGVPFQAFSRNPQIRFTYTIDKVKLIAAAMSQRDFQSHGPAGLSSSYLRNSVIPNLHAQLQYAGSGTMLGIGIDYKRLTPRLVTAANVATDVTISSAGLLGYIKVNLDPVVVKAEGTYGGNLSDLLMLGGYATTSVDTVTGVERYSPLRSFSLWGEISTGSDVEVALFAGYAKNLGAGAIIAGPYYGRGTDIKSLLRISPRLVWNASPVRYSAELEHTSAGYGTPNNLDKGQVENTRSVTNVRLLLAAYYFF